MKINPDFPIPGTGSLKDTTGNKETSGTNSFSDVLDQVSAKRSADVAHSTATHLEAQSLFNNPLPSAAQTDAIGAGEHALDLLDHLSGILMEHNSIEGGLDTVATALDSNTRDLVQIRDTLDAQDPLRNALDEIAIMSVVTSMKIERGDFNLS